MSEVVTGGTLTHVDAAGHARMVDVSGKDVTARSARATGRVLLSAQAVAALRAGEVPKGDALAVARIAGITGAKRTPDLIPLCHPIGLHGVTVDLAVTDEGVDITAKGASNTLTRLSEDAEKPIFGAARIDAMAWAVTAIPADLKLNRRGVKALRRAGIPPSGPMGR